MKIGEVLEKNKKKILRAWVKELKDEGSDASFSPAKLGETYEKGLQAYAQVFKDGKFQKMRNFIERVSTLRGPTEFNLASVQKSLFSFRRAFFPFLEKEYQNDFPALTEGLKELDEAVEVTLSELAQVYERTAKATLSSYLERIAEIDKKIEELTVTDSLTGLLSYRYFTERLTAEIGRVKRYGRPFSLALFDIDYLSQYNQKYGEPNGDLLIRKIGEILAGSSREVDFWARHEGGRFIAAFPETEKMDATVASERLRKLVEEHSFSGGETQPAGRVTLSGAVTNFPADTQNQDELVNLAQKLLQEAKKKGRNQIYFVFKQEG